MIISPIKIQSTWSKSIGSELKSSNTIYKLRQIFINNLIPDLLDDDFSILRSIIAKAWISNINNFTIESVLYNSVFETRINSVQRCINNAKSFVFRVDYTISIADKDPEYLGINEPTQDEYENAFLDYGPSSSVQLCKCFGFQSIRLYISTLGVDIKNQHSIISDLVVRLWNQQNPLHPISSRLSFSLSTIDGYYSLSKNNLTRIDLAWVVDNDNPNPIYFNVPTEIDLVQLLSSVNIKIYKEVPFQMFTIYLRSFSDSNAHLLSRLVSHAWSLRNKMFSTIDFEVSIQANSNSENIKT